MSDPNPSSQISFAQAFFCSAFAACFAEVNFLLLLLPFFFISFRFHFVERLIWSVLTCSGTCIWKIELLKYASDGIEWIKLFVCVCVEVMKSENMPLKVCAHYVLDFAHFYQRFSRMG